MVTERIKCCKNEVQQDSDIVWFEKEHIQFCTN